MATFNIAFQREQEQRESYDELALQAEADYSADLYYGAEFDGKTGLKPKHPDNDIYWEGYVAGLRIYWKRLK
jgi:hypothetical protein